MSTDLVKLMEDYTNGAVTRRDFLRRAIFLTGSIAAANSVFGSLLGDEASAAMVSPNDPALLTHEIEYAGKAGAVSGYLARPAAQGKFPGIIVIHENRGLNDHIRDVARRLAKEGYVALAPDYLSRHGGTKKVNPKGGGIRNIRELITADTGTEDTASGIAYLRSLPDVRSGGMGVVGFCGGGGMCFLTATRLPQLRAAVVYYGSSPQPLDVVKNLRAPVLAHYGEEDPRINKGIPATEKAMREYGKSYTYKIYTGAKHAFNNNTWKDRYNPSAAKEAWGKTLEFFAKNLKG